MSKKIILLFLVTILLGSLLPACSGSAADKNAKDLLRELNVKGKKFFNQPGWVHVTEKIMYDTDKQDRGTLPSGTIIPLVQVVDIWYHINSSKLVYEYVWTMSSQSGEPIEVTVFLHNLLYNLTTNISNPLNPYTLSLDYQFADELDYFISNSGNHPVVKTALVDGINTTVFTLDEKLSSPRTTTDYTQPINAIGTIASFDTETGLLLKLVRTVTLADGTRRIFYTDSIKIEKSVQPPQDVQDYVNGFW
jgi:hypothetical protein